MSAKLATVLLGVLGLAIAPAGAYAAGNTYDANSGTTQATPSSQGATGSTNDSAITARIHSEFAKDQDLSRSDIKVHADNGGVVTLSGAARSKTEADKAVSLVRRTEGVKTVRNQLTVGPATGADTGMVDSASGAIGSSALGGTVGTRSGGTAHKPN